MRDFDNENDVPWKNFFKNITSLVVEEGVISIGANAFYNVPTLTYAKYSSQLEKLSIGARAFCDREEAKLNIETIREYAISQIEELLYISNAEKEDYKQRISDGSSKEAVSAIVKEAETNDDAIYQNELSSREISEAKETAKSMVSVCKYLNQAEKDNFNAQIEAAQTSEAIYQIADTAKTQNQASTNVQTYKSNAMFTIETIDLLSQPEIDNYKKQLESALNTNDIDNILATANIISMKKADTTRPFAFHDQAYGGFNNQGSTAPIANIH